MTNRLWRLAYWVGFRLARAWWWLRRPYHRGALVAIWCDGRILGVRQSYRSNLSWPGGSINPREDPKDAARRELTEELGLTVPVDALVPVGVTVVDWDFRRDHVHIFELHLQAEPVFRIDEREIVAAKFFAPGIMMADKQLPPFIRSYLEEKAPFRDLFVQPSPHQ
jgi:8-oxo-dGTP diphosphatase